MTENSKNLSYLINSFKFKYVIVQFKFKFFFIFSNHFLFVKLHVSDDCKSSCPISMDGGLCSPAVNGHEFMQSIQIEFCKLLYKLLK